MEEVEGDDRRSLWLRASDDGSLMLEGQDLGPKVEAYFGPGIREYEFGFALTPEQVRGILARLGIPECDQKDRAVFVRTVGHAAKDLSRSDLQEAFRESGASFWSRSGS
jgi:hypothetical protein